MVGCHGEADGDEFRKQVGGLLRLFSCHPFVTYNCFSFLTC